MENDYSVFIVNYVYCFCKFCTVLILLKLQLNLQHLKLNSVYLVLRFGWVFVIFRWVYTKNPLFLGYLPGYPNPDIKLAIPCLTWETITGCCTVVRVRHSGPSHTEPSIPGYWNWLS